jgi:hypothetical protein
MAIADVQLVGTGDHAFGDGMGGGEDYIVVFEVELLDRQGHEGQVILETILGTGKVLEKGCADLASIEVTVGIAGFEIDQGMEIRINVLQNFFDD